MPSQNHFDAIALLKADHRKVEVLFAHFEAAKGAAKKQALVQNICTKLSAHTVIEEEIFYPACRGKVEEGLLHEGCVEHDGSKVLIAELIASAPSEEFYDAKVKVLSELIEHHVHEGGEAFRRNLLASPGGWYRYECAWRVPGGPEGGDPG